MPYIKSKLCFEQPHFRHGAPRSRPIFRTPARITRPGLPPPETLQKYGFEAPDSAHPIIERINGSIIEQLNRKKARQFRTQHHIYIYIYIYIYAVKSIIGPSLGVCKVNNWAKFVFLNRLCQKTIKIGVSANF